MRIDPSRVRAGRLAGCFEMRALLIGDAFFVALDFGEGMPLDFAMLDCVHSVLQRRLVGDSRPRTF